MTNLRAISKIFLSILFALLLVGLHIVLPTPGGSGLYLIPNILTWLAISLLIAIALIKIAKQRTFLWSKYHIGYLVGIALLIVPVFYGGEFADKAIPRLLGLVGGVLFLSSLIQMKFSEQQRFSVLLFFLIAIAVECLIGLFQFFLLSLFDIQVVGYTPIYGRPYGSFIQPNVMASFLASGLGVACFALHHLEKYRYKRFTFGLSLFVLLSSPILLVVLQSKTGYVAAIAVLALMLPTLTSDKKQLKTIIIVLLSGVLVGAFSFKYLKTVPTKANIYSDDVRTTIIQVSAKMYANKPIMGYGYGEFEKQYREYHLELQNKGEITQAPLEDLGHPHNEVLLWAIEGGAVAIIGLVVLIIAALRLMAGLTLQQKLQFIALLLPIILHSLLEYPFYHSTIHWIYLIAILWFIEAQHHSNALRQITLPNGIKVLANVSGILLLLGAVVYFSILLHTSYHLEAYKRSNNQKIEHITSIIHPLAWQDHYQLIIYQQGLINGYRQQNPEALLRYIEWGAEFVKYRPRKAVYQNMLSAIDTLRKNNSAIDSELVNQIRQDAVRLYPNK